MLKLKDVGLRGGGTFGLGRGLEEMMGVGDGWEDAFNSSSGLRYKSSASFVAFSSLLFERNELL